MYITPYFGGCKYTNNFLFINKNIEIQCIGLLITTIFPYRPCPFHHLDRAEQVERFPAIVRQLFVCFSVGKSPKHC